MIGLAVAAAFAMVDKVLPQGSTLWQLPPMSTAAEQMIHCEEHLERLRCLGAVRGWSGGFWEDAIKETKRHQRYWQLLHAAHDVGWQDNLYRRVCLQRLKDHIGAADFLGRWRPPDIPEASRFEPRIMPPAPP